METGITKYDGRQIMLDENNNWFGNSANKHEGIKAAKKLHPSYTNKQIASLLNIDSNLVANYNQITEAIKNNLIDKSIISKINTYADIGVLSSVANDHAIKYENILEVHKKALADSRKNSKTGKITKTNVLEALAQSLTVGQVGAVLVLEMAAHQYSTSEISRIIESEGSQILGIWLTNKEGSGRIQVSIKLNTQNAERIIKSLQRFSYEVIAIFGDEDYRDNVESRFESLMKYIDI